MHPNQHLNPLSSYTLKHLPQDFIVIERASLNLLDQGSYLYIQCTKQERSTMEIASYLAKILGIKEKDVGYAGTKDTHAITTQYFSLREIKSQRLTNLKISNVDLKIIGYGQTPLSLGDLEGNHFQITLRNLNTNVSFPHLSIPHLSLSPNYFDEQRFSQHNIEVGRALLKKDFKKAATIIDHASCQEYITTHPTNPIAALRTLPDRLLRLYLNAYQSYLWNETVGMYLQQHSKEIYTSPYSAGSLIFIKDQERFIHLQFPLLGFATLQSPDPQIQHALSTILQRENLTATDFVIRQLPNLSLEGEMRSVFVRVEDLKVGEYDSDECFEGKYKLKVCFFLPKGSYATMFMRRLFMDESISYTHLSH